MNGPLYAMFCEIQIAISNCFPRSSVTIFLAVVVSGLSFCSNLSFISLNSCVLLSVVCMPCSLMISPYSEQNADSASVAIDFELFITGRDSNGSGERVARRVVGDFFYNPGSVLSTRQPKIRRKKAISISTHSTQKSPKISETKVGQEMSGKK